MSVKFYSLGIIRKSLYLAKKEGNISSQTLSQCLDYLDIYADLFKSIYKISKSNYVDNLEWSE